MQKIRIAMVTLLMVLVMAAQAVAAPAPEKIALEKNHSKYLDLWGLDSIAVGNPEIADITVVSNREVLIVAKSQGSTSLQVKFKSGNRRTYLIVVTDSDRAVAESIESMLNYPNVTVSKVGENIVLDGIVEDQIEKKRAETIAKMFGKSVTNLLEMENPKQIKIEAKIVEIDSDKVDKIGLQYFDTRGNTGSFNIGQSVGRGKNKGAYGWFGDYDPINANLNLLITNGFAKVLSQPNVVTMSGEKANILIGGEIPIPISNSDGQISIEWHEYGIKLDIEPTASSDGQITGKINAEVSSLDVNSAAAINTDGKISIPALRSRKAETVITLKSGNTMAIGGLISSDESKQIVKVPLLGDLPILGQFFRSTSKNKERKEIIILVTPTLVDEKYDTPMSHDLKSFISDKAKAEEKLAKSPEQVKEEEKLEKEKAEKEKIKLKAEEEKKKQQEKIAAEKAKQLEKEQVKAQAELEKMQKEQAKAQAEKVKQEKAEAEKLKKDQEKAAKEQAKADKAEAKAKAEADKARKIADAAKAKADAAQAEADKASAALKQKTAAIAKPIEKSNAVTKPVNTVKTEKTNSKQNAQSVKTEQKK